MIGQFLLGGAVNALVLVLIAFLLSRFAGEVYGRALLAIFLFIAAGAYVGFAVAGGASGLWFLAEIVQAVVIGAMGLLGMRGSPYWIAAGWAVHPLWDVLHYFGAGHAFAPEAWAISCVSFDLLVAAYIVLAYRYGLVGRTARATAGETVGAAN
jgi:ABC-type xylose transport system permease subunit